MNTPRPTLDRQENFHVDPMHPPCNMVDLAVRIASQRAWKEFKESFETDNQRHINFRAQTPQPIPAQRRQGVVFVPNKENTYFIPYVPFDID